MTAAEFYAGYAERSGCTVEDLAALGRRAYPCHCGEEDCPGWAMLPGDLVDEARRDGLPMALGVYTSDLGYAP